MYLPSYQNVSKKYKYVLSQKIINFVNEMNIPIIDIYDEVFLVHSDPLSLFPFIKSVIIDADAIEIAQP